MATRQTSSIIARHLRKLVSKAGLTLDYVSVSTKLSPETVRQARNGNTRLRDRTAFLLAEFIEKETEGEVRATDLVQSGSPANDYSFTDLKNVDFSGEDLSGWKLIGADLAGADLSNCALEETVLWRADLTGANLANVTGTGPDFTGAKMNGVNLVDTRIERWDFTGTTNWRGATIQGCSVVGGIVTGADWTGASIRDLTWRSGGGESFGFRIDFHPEEIRDGYNNPEMITYLLEAEADGDPEILHIAWQVRCRRIPSHWIGLLRTIEKEYPGALTRMLDIAYRYPLWHLPGRISLAYEIIRCSNVEDLLALKSRADYAHFRWDIEAAIHREQAREGI